MKLASTTDLLIPDSGDLELAVHKACERGLDGMAISVTPASFFNMENLKPGSSLPFLQHARHHKLQIMCLYGLTLFGKEPEAEKSCLKKAICFSHAVGSELVSLRVGVKPGEAPMEVIKEIISDAADFAEDLDVCLGIEPVKDTAIDSLSAALDLIDSVDSTHLGLVYDPALHSFSDEKMPMNAAEVIKSYLLMIVLSPSDERNVEETHKALLLLHKAGFEDYVLVNAEGHMAHHMSEAVDEFAGLKAYLTEIGKEDRFSSC